MSGKIVITKTVVFKDEDGNTLKTFNIGDIINYTCKLPTYYVTSWGGIYNNEAEEINDVEQALHTS